jgi:hyperosmotically inducible protein
MKSPALALAIAIGLAACGEGTAPGNPASTPTAPPQGAATGEGTVGPGADNSARNRSDGKDALTPLDQGTGEEDVKETTAVRKAIIADKDLSINAQNIKIITQNGNLTLRGTVNTSAERDRVNQIVREAIGAKPYRDQLNIVQIK